MASPVQLSGKASDDSITGAKTQTSGSSITQGGTKSYVFGSNSTASATSSTGSIPAVVWYVAAGIGVFWAYKTFFKNKKGGK